MDLRSQIVVVVVAVVLAPMEVVLDGLELLDMVVHELMPNILLYMESHIPPAQVVDIPLLHTLDYLHKE